MDNNHKMWSDLGMNLELHDQLCEVLPQAFGDVFLSQENRPEGGQPFLLNILPFIEYLPGLWFIQPANQG